MPLYLFPTLSMPAAAPVKETEKVSGQKPITTFRARGVSAAVFANAAKSDGRDLTFFKVKCDRSYKDGDEWKHTDSFGRDDLPLLKRVLDQAWDYILNAEASRGKEGSAE